MDANAFKDLASFLKQNRLNELKNPVDCLLFVLSWCRGFIRTTFPWLRLFFGLIGQVIQDPNVKYIKMQALQLPTLHCRYQQIRCYGVNVLMTLHESLSPQDGDCSAVEREKKNTTSVGPKPKSQKRTPRLVGRVINAVS